MNEIKQDLAELVEEFTEYPRIYELGKRLVTAIDDVEQVAQENATLTQQFQKAQGEIEWLQAEAAAHLDALQKTLVYCRDIEEKVGNVYMGTLANQLDGYLEDSTTAGASFLARYKQYEAVVEAAKKRKVAKAHFDKLFEAAMQDNDMTPQQAGEVGLTELDVWQADDVLDAALAALDKGGE